jgi:DNA modification methylase
MQNFINKIINENCLSGLKQIPDGVIDCCVTSPPYWGLRDYGHDEQIGNEENFEDFISKLIEIYTEIKRVLKPTGTCFVNLGDTYAWSGSGTTKNADTSKYIENSK